MSASCCWRHCLQQPDRSQPPHPQNATQAPDADGDGGFTTEDLDAALAHYCNQVLDISRADLAGLLHMAGRAAFQRTLGELRATSCPARPWPWRPVSP